jgi:hypothetical protein
MVRYKWVARVVRVVIYDIAIVGERGGQPKSGDSLIEAYDHIAKSGAECPYVFILITSVIFA